MLPRFKDWQSLFFGFFMFYLCDIINSIFNDWNTSFVNCLHIALSKVQEHSPVTSLPKTVFGSDIFRTLSVNSWLIFTSSSNFSFSSSWSFSWVVGNGNRKQCLSLKLSLMLFLTLFAWEAFSPWPLLSCRLHSRYSSGLTGFLFISHFRKKSRTAQTNFGNIASRSSDDNRAKFSSKA